MDQNLVSPREDFRRARQRAAIQAVLARLSGRSTDLLSYEEVRRQINAFSTGIPRGTQDIPLDAIIGSAGRYTDFTRSFLPRNPNDQDRWARVMAATNDPAGSGLPPIEVYKIGSAYFVLDGHHRISVARELGASHIQAYVTEIPTDLPITPETHIEDLLLMSEQAAFLEQTHLKVMRPQSDVRISECCGYPQLLEHVQMHQYFMGIDEQREVTSDEAVAHWYDTVYVPVVDAIHAKGLLRDFPGRTEADIYLWVSEHRMDLQQGLAGSISPEAAAQHLAEKESPRASRVAARIGRSLVEAMVPDSLLGATPTGRWREERTGAERLFRDLLVPLRGDEAGWAAFDQALIFAQRESANIQAMHVLADAVNADDPGIRALGEEVLRRCNEAGVTGNFVIESGEISRNVLERALLSDMVIVHLSHPPSQAPLVRLAPGFHTLLRRCARPVLAVPEAATALDRILLAYDGSSKANEALFVAAYLCEKWNVSLSVLTVSHGAHANEKTLEYADKYLKERNLQARLICESGMVAETILKVAAAEESRLLVLGGYGNNPMTEAMLGSDLDAILRASHLPMLICR
jgi:nucleotide-binding universal stress UspA family protein